ncbi:MAG: 50S ribosomal protein L1 [Candidatus Omnitrophica bacterium]|nr:50S ribosomal protein L1 [Candidatus Omnitrophota bacterium]MCM8826987.1 50S ribosomal protein L1 [Candidatus Omnitrophota bacterium]
MKKSKRYQQAVKLIDKDIYNLDEAIDILKSMPRAKFDESVDINCVLAVDTKKSEEMVRGFVVLPNGRGKKVKVLVFCELEKEEEAKKAGADYIGSQELADKILKEGWLDFDACISTPSMMRVVSKLGKILGPKGLMPSPKIGTVTDNIANAVKETKAGKVEFRTDKFGVVALSVGKISFSKQALLENIKAFLDALNNAKPSSVKGDFIKSMYISTTMSPSLKIKI